MKSAEPCAMSADDAACPKCGPYCNEWCVECPNALLPCPFCGSRADYAEVTDEDGRFVVVQCSGCGVGSGRHYPLMDDARPNAACEWNRRTMPTREELARAVKPWCWIAEESALEVADAILMLLEKKE